MLSGSEEVGAPVGRAARRLQVVVRVGRSAYRAGVPFAVVLDACVLYPLPLRDTLLRVAQQSLYAVRWSRRILDEVTRNLIEDRRATPDQAKGLVDAMQRVRGCRDPGS
jgi:hypothetical protein